jgi:hypothetical protein
MDSRKDRGPLSPSLSNLPPKKLAGMKDPSRFYRKKKIMPNHSKYEYEYEFIRSTSNINGREKFRLTASHRTRPRRFEQAADR